MMNQPTAANESTALTGYYQQQRNASSFQPPVSIYCSSMPSPSSTSGTDGAKKGKKDDQEDQEERQSSLNFITRHPYKWELFKLTNRSFWWAYVLFLVHVGIGFAPSFVGGHDAFTCNGFPDTNTTMNVSCSSLSHYLYDNEAGGKIRTGSINGVIVVPCPTNTTTTTSIGEEPVMVLEMAGGRSSSFDPLNIYQNVGLQIWLTMPIEDISFLYCIVISVLVAVLTLPLLSPSSNTAAIHAAAAAAAPGVTAGDSDITTKRRAGFHRGAIMGVKICLIFYLIWKTSWILIGTDLLWNVCSYSVTPKPLLFGAYYFYICECIFVSLVPAFMRRTLTRAREFLATEEGHPAVYQKLEEGNFGKEVEDTTNCGCQQQEKHFAGCESATSLLAQQQTGEVSLLGQEDDSPSLQL